MRHAVLAAAAGVLCLLAACGEPSAPSRASSPPAPPLSKAEAALPTSELVRVGTIADHPAGAVHVALLEDGTIVVPTGDGSFGAFEEYLRALASTSHRREGDGALEVDLVLRVHPHLGWEAVQWVMMAGAQPTVKAYRFSFAVRPEDDGPEGSMAAWLPTDGRVRIVVGHDWQVALAGDANEVDPGTALAAFRKAFEAAGRSPELGADIVVPSPRRVAAGHVLRTIDLLHRAGIARVQFEGKSFPAERGAGREGGERDWLRKYVAAHPLPQAGFRLRFEGQDLFGTPGEPVLALPAVPRLHPVAPGGSREEAASEDPEVTEEVHAESFVGPEDLPVEETPVDANTSTPETGSAFQARAGSRREGPGPGGQSKKEAATLHALRWLAAHQADDGGWQAQGFAGWCDGKPTTGEKPDGAGKAVYDVGVTGLALLAFLGAGYTNRGEHEFARVVRKGLSYLKNVQDPEGCFGRRDTDRYVYNHALAATAMVEAYGMTESPIYRGSAQKALDFIALARNPYFAWRYGVKPGDNDTSITGWMMTCLEVARWINESSAKRGKRPLLVLDDDAWDGIRAWLDKVTDPDTGRVGYQMRGAGSARSPEAAQRFPITKSEAMTAVGVLARVFSDEDPRTSRVLQRGATLVGDLPPMWNPADGSIDMVHWVFGALALFQLGGHPWNAWDQALDTAVVMHQRLDGTHCTTKGSWDPLDPWGSEGGRVYSTAMCCLALETTWRYERIVPTGGK